jgi:hypothetical protein
MGPDLVERFFTEEYNDYVKQRLLEALQHQHGGVKRFTFNVFNIVLNMANGTVTIEDALEADSDHSMPLADFRARLLKNS